MRNLRLMHACCYCDALRPSTIRLVVPPKKCGHFILMIVIRDHGQFSRPTPADIFSINPSCMPIASTVADFSHNLILCGEVMRMQRGYIMLLSDSHTIFLCNRFYSKCVGFTVCFIYSNISINIHMDQ